MFWVALDQLFHETALKSLKYIEDTDPLSDDLSLNYDIASIKTIYSFCLIAFYSMSLLSSKVLFLAPYPGLNKTTQ